MRGHGTYSHSGNLVSSNAGVVARVNKLVSVRPLRGRYVPSVGDIVVGRVSEVGSKRWKLDIQAHKEAVLHLSSVNLPGGEQRMRSYEDQLSMRSFFAEGDLVSAEVQGVQSDGSASLHTRSLKYGKLENGLVYQAPACLIPRLKQHSLVLDCGVDLILGNNGFVWITRARAEVLGADAEAEAIESEQRCHASTVVLPDERLRICRVRNCVAALCSMSALVTPEAITLIYNRSEAARFPPKALLEPDVVFSLVRPDDDDSDSDDCAEDGGAEVMEDE